MGHYASGRELDRHKNPRQYPKRTGDRHSAAFKEGRKRSYHRGINQDFIGVDGEGVGNDYVLLDSSLESYPRLYTGRRLDTLGILDWIWDLGQKKEGKGKDIILYGASYDYNNWMRAIDYTDVVKLAKSQVVRYPPYAVLWQKGYKFEIRKYGDNVDRLTHRSIGLVAWDGLPYWQTTFIKALEMTLRDVPELITEGKSARGSFTHDRIEWMSDYNRLECKLLVSIMRELVQWFSEAGIDLISWNGPGAAAKALLRQKRPYLHAGRELHSTKSSGVGNYTHPLEITEAMLSAYAGGRNQIVQVGTLDIAKQYDIISAYPYAMCYLPCLSHGQWEKVKRYEPRQFGVWKFHYEASDHMRAHGIYPFFHRDAKDGSIHYPSIVYNRWAYSSEIAAALKHDPEGVHIDYGWVWRPADCEEPRPLAWVHQAFQTRKGYKKAGKTGAATALKLALNSIYGSLAQARGGLPDDPPWSQQLIWAGATTAAIRARLFDAAMTNPWAVLHMATDGIISSDPLSLRIGTKLGEWEETWLHDLTLIQYGVYFSREKGRSRGFTMQGEDAERFLAQVHAQWDGGGYETVWYDVNYFVTAALVAEGLEPYDEWCNWKSRTEKLSTRLENAYETVDRPKLGSLTRVREEERYLRLLCQEMGSAPYGPKWGKGMTFEEDLTEDAINTATNA